MDPASAIGIASFGIQVCQGLLSYYDGYKDYKGDIEEARASITDLCGIFEVLEESLRHKGLQQEQTQVVEERLGSCEAGLKKLEEKLQKLQGFHVSDGLRRKAYTEIQRLWYPLYPKTIAKLRALVGDLQSRLSLALGVLHLNQGATAQQSLADVQTTLDDVAAGVRDIRLEQDAERFRQLVAWLDPPDPWVNHAAARRHHEPKTGEWLLQSRSYTDWKIGNTRHLTLKGKAGCGKTILSSTVIEDVKQYCEGNPNIGFAVFYFSFAEKRKQSFDSMLLSLISQLGTKGKALSMLQREYDRANRSANRSPPGQDILLEILTTSIQQYGSVYLILDALDECPESDGARREMLDGLSRLCENDRRLRTFTTARPLRDIEDCIINIRAAAIPVSTNSVDSDITMWVERQLRQDRRLSGLDDVIKNEIKDTFARKSDGMFRWAYCQLQELKKLKSTKPKFVRMVLAALPTSLDETYERMLLRIDEVLQGEALVLLQWLSYALHPLTLLGLAETTIIDPTDGGTVDFSDRGSVYDTVEILEGLITLERDKSDDDDEVDDDDFHDEYDTTDDDDENSSSVSQHSDVQDSRGSALSETRSIIRVHGPYDCDRRYAASVRVKLAHFSVQEFLENDRTLRSRVGFFHLEAAGGHELLGKACLTYLTHYTASPEKTYMEKDFATFPLAEYAASAWPYHTRRQKTSDVPLPVSFLAARATRLDWASLMRSSPTMFRKQDTSPSALYYASDCGLDEVVRGLLELGHNPNDRGDAYGTVLYAAVHNNHKRIVQLLIDKGVDVNDGSFAGNPLQMALSRRHERVAEMLIDAGADVNAKAGAYGRALKVASARGLARAVDMLIRAGAAVNEGGESLRGTSLDTALRNGHAGIAKALIRAGAVGDSNDDQLGYALLEASTLGHALVVESLIAEETDMASHGTLYGTALGIASEAGDERIVQVLLDGGVDPNARAGTWDISPLWRASRAGHESVVQRLIVAGVDINRKNGSGEIALHAASYEGHEKVVRRLICAGADLNMESANPPWRRVKHIGYDIPLLLAAFGVHKEAAKVLLRAGADLEVALSRCNEVDGDWLKRLAAEVFAEKGATEVAASSQGHRQFRFRIA